MRQVPKNQILTRVRNENPWWEKPHQVGQPYRSWSPRSYLRLFLPLVRSGVQRAVVLMGPRRVGKTVLLHHAIKDLLAQGIAPRRIAYFSVDHPLYDGLALERLVELFLEATGGTTHAGPTVVIFDEIQYLKSWEVHLKRLVDDRPEIRFIASGSAAAALRLKSGESGAGRFTEFLLPPLTFFEYLDLQDRAELFAETDAGVYRAVDREEANERFVHYLSFGGYPEVVLSPEIQASPRRFVKADIIDKVLLRDLPSLYGIQDIQELNSLFTSLAYNTAGELSLEELSKGSGVAKNTIKRYIEYLEAAFLVRIVHRVDRSARRFKRANFFKVYLTNPSLRAALFSPLAADDAEIGPLVETAVFAQWFHGDATLHYARWPHGEVDMVLLEGIHPSWAVEVKWSDRTPDKLSELRALIGFCKQNRLPSALVTTRSRADVQVVDGVEVEFRPVADHCFSVGRNLIHGRGSGGQLTLELPPAQGAAE